MLKPDEQLRCREALRALVDCPYPTICALCRDKIKMIMKVLKANEKVEALDHETQTRSLEGLGDSTQTTVSADAERLG